MLAGWNESSRFVRLVAGIVQDGGSRKKLNGRYEQCCSSIVRKYHG